MVRVDVPSPEGTMVTARIEKRSSGDVIIISLRDNDKPGRLLCETNPKKFPPKNLREDLAGLEIEEQIQLVVAGMLSDLLKKFYNPRTNDGIDRRVKYPMSLSQLWAVDKDDLRIIYDWAASTKKRYDNAVKEITSHRDWDTWTEATPRQVAPVLDKLSLAKAEDGARVLQFLFRHQMEMSLVNVNPWEGYRITGRIKRPSYSALIQKNIDAVMLTNGQVKDVIDECFRGLETPQGGLYLGALLMLTTLLKPEEICGLDEGQRHKYRDYGVTVLNVDRVYRLDKENGRGKNYRLEKLGPSAEKRIISVALVAEDAIGIRIGYLKKKHGKDAVKKIPYVSTPKNVYRRCTPKQLTDWMECSLRPSVPSLKGLPKKKKLARLFSETARRNFKSNGYEVEELRYQEGAKPKLVSAKYYNDFTAEPQLNKLKKLQCRWLCRCGQEKTEKIIKTENTVVLDYSKRIGMTYVLNLENIPYDKIPDSGIELLCVADSGADISIDYEEGT